MNSNPRRAPRHIHRERLPAYFLLAKPHTENYLDSVDAAKRTIVYCDEHEALKIPTREEAKAIAEALHGASGIRLAVCPRYAPCYH